MANFIYITLDTTAPSNPSIKVAGDLIYTTSQLVSLTVGTGDSVTTDYQMKIWGDVDTAYNTNIKNTEALSAWIPYSTNPQIKLSIGDGTKTVNLRIRDDVHNASSVASDSINLDTKIPTVTVTNADMPKVSKNVGKDTSSFAFSSDKDIQEYKVKLVGVTNATHDTGITVQTTNGSVNTSGSQTIAVGQITTVTIKGADIEIAGAVSNNQSIVKVFVKDALGNWSV